MAGGTFEELAYMNYIPEAIVKLVPESEVKKHRYDIAFSDTKKCDYQFGGSTITKDGNKTDVCVNCYRKLLGKKMALRVGLFNNSDAKNSQINQVLDVQQKQFLSELGDSIQEAYYSSAVIDTFAAGKILYEKLFSGIDSFYQYSTDPLLAKYSLSFIDVGVGAGNYIADFNGANGSPQSRENSTLRRRSSGLNLSCTYS